MYHFKITGKKYEITYNEYTEEMVMRSIKNRRRCRRVYVNETELTYIITKIDF